MTTTIDYIHTTPHVSDEWAAWLQTRVVEPDVVKRRVNVLICGTANDIAQSVLEQGGDIEGVERALLEEIGRVDALAERGPSWVPLGVDGLASQRHREAWAKDHGLALLRGGAEPPDPSPPIGLSALAALGRPGVRRLAAELDALNGTARAAQAADVSTVLTAMERWQTREDVTRALADKDAMIGLLLRRLDEQERVILELQDRGALSGGWFLTALLTPQGEDLGAETGPKG